MADRNDDGEAIVAATSDTATTTAATESTPADTATVTTVVTTGTSSTATTTDTTVTTTDTTATTVTTTSAPTVTFTTTATTTLTTTAATTTAGATTTTFTQPTTPPPSGTPRVYWRAADTENTAVITGFEYLPQGGVLRIPATVDGKMVVGIDMRQAQGLAFDIPSVCQRITTLYLPPSIQRIPDGLFVHFTNLCDLYIGSDDFYMPPTALPAVSARAGILTLHTPSNGWCAFANDAFSACCFSLYSATHATWDPTDIYGEGTV